MKKSKESPTSIWEILEIVQSASESVRPFAIKFAQKVASMELKETQAEKVTPGSKGSNPTKIVTTG